MKREMLTRNGFGSHIRKKRKKNLVSGDIIKNTSECENVTDASLCFIKVPDRPVQCNPPGKLVRSKEDQRKDTCYSDTQTECPFKHTYCTFLMFTH